MKARRQATATARKTVRRFRRQIGPVLWRPSAPPDEAVRLVRSPAFVLSPVRSGSTLLRVLLNSHSRIRAPHELHLRHVHVRVSRARHVQLAMEALDLDRDELEYLLWDRIMHRELQRSGKEVFVDKTPQNVDIWRRLDRGWPEARYIFLIRHPAAIAESLSKAKPNVDPDVNADRVLELAQRLDTARADLPGRLVRYEDLCDDPGRVTKELCAFLQVPWEPTMLDYGSHSHGDFKFGIGDASANIRSGEVRAPRPLPTAAEIPLQLREQARVWGYL